ncbi:MAG: prolipoprotein diacylglyceryl transferase [Myxococcota bacterium]|jgi:phosphatidylglycerol:prolipoprotein diacylglycerol transferase|nr:prolipoprotein diacylglyceryl transferase [Myxococcota bacterium]
MYPVLFGEGEWALPSYFAMLMLGYMLAVYLLRWQVIQRGLDVRRAVDIALVLLLAGVIGARLAHVLFDGYLQDYIDLCRNPDAMGKPLPDGSPCASDGECLDFQDKGFDIGSVCKEVEGKGRVCVPEQDCLRALKFWSGGLTYYGGLLLAMLAAVVLTRRWGFRFLDYADMTAPGIALALAFGRIGCFLSGCCFGGVCEAPWAVHFPAGSDAWRLHRREHWPELVAQYRASGVWESLSVHPTQLYESGAMLLTFALLWFGLRKRRRFEGQSIAWLMILYSLVRFTIEFWRADQRGGVGWFSTSQWISVPLLLLGVYLLWRGSKQQSVSSESAQKD